MWKTHGVRAAKLGRRSGVGVNDVIIVCRCPAPIDPAHRWSPPTYGSLHAISNYIWDTHLTALCDIQPFVLRRQRSRSSVVRWTRRMRRTCCVGLQHTAREAPDAIALLLHSDGQYSQSQTACACLGLHVSLRLHQTVTPIWRKQFCCMRLLKIKSTSFTCNTERAQPTQMLKTQAYVEAGE